MVQGPHKKHNEVFKTSSSSSSNTESKMTHGRKVTKFTLPVSGGKRVFGEGWEGRKNVGSIYG